MMKVALVLLPEYSPDFPYLGLGYLAAALRRAKHAVSVFDYNVETYAASQAQRDWLWSKDIAQTWTHAHSFFGEVWPHIAGILSNQLERLLAGTFDVVAFSAFDTNQHSTNWMIRQLKTRQPNVKVIVGGPSCDTSQFRQANDFGLIDALVCGEGEVSLVELVSRAARGLHLRNAPGTVFGPVQPPLDVAELPIPDFSDQVHLPYRSVQQPIQFSRGCPYRCAFCTERTLWPGFRRRPPQSIVEELVTRHRRSGMGKFISVDALLNADPRWLMEVADRIRECRLEISWGGNLRVNPKMTRAVFGRLREAGFSHAVFGVESGSKHVLERMSKGIDPATSLRNIRDCARVGIVTIVNILVGFHGEKEADFGMTYELISRMWRYIDGMNLSRFWPGNAFDWSIPDPVSTEQGDKRKACLEPAVTYLAAETETRERLERELTPLMGVTRARSLVLRHLRRGRPSLVALSHFDVTGFREALHERAARHT